jgi:hypothetical protein
MTVCGNQAASCQCVLPLLHPGRHACDPKCGAEWTGRYGTGNFKVLAYPQGTINNPDFRAATNQQGETNGI